jgi:Rps23 Pro-64 3,4-dihydroxylase Tpa1-like proline 4-hydroxylase
MNKEDIKSIKNFVEPEDAQYLVDLMEDLKSKNQLSNERGDGTHRLYNSDNIILTNFVKKYSKKFIDGRDLYVTENLVALYEEGSFMKAHVDAPDDVEFVSTVIYLNDDYTGGELSFPQVSKGYTYVPQKYELIYFPTPFLHGVKPVKSGKRYIITISYTDKIQYKNLKY